MSEKCIAIGKTIILSIVLGASLVSSAIVIANGFDSIAKPDRTVTVRGLAEREVDADLAIWRSSYKFGANTLQEAQNAIHTKNQVVIAYLKEKGLTEAEIVIQAPEITETDLDRWNNNAAKFPVLATQSFIVRSNNIQSVKNAQLDVSKLLSQGVAISEGFSGIDFQFTKLNDIKPEMIGEATKNARKAAENFAIDSKSSVGKIKSATQGYFSVEDATIGLEDKKNVRVVTTVEFLLAD